MALSAGTRLGSYEVLSAIGAGGMGEVYRARDTKLKREVALKVLPDAFAHDPDRLARFQREAELLATLNHPNIAAVYGLEHTEGVNAIVLELVEGPTLANLISDVASDVGRTSSGPAQAGPHDRVGLPLGEALPIARQIADAHQAAHAHGVIHRDLKPANIKVRPDGAVKVLDFGLAKLAQTSGSGLQTAGLDVTASPTIAPPAATGMGVIMGTAAYMAPEQARGRDVDKRADLWAFGCVLYEMLAGKRAFDGEDATDTIAAVVRGEPDWGALPATVPAAIRTLLQRCLEKDRRRRTADISVAQFVLEQPASVAPAGPVAGHTRDEARRPPVWRRVATVAISLVVGGLLTGSVVWFATRPGTPRVSRLMIAPSIAAALTVSGNDRDLAISPDGARIAYLGPNGTLFVRALDQLEPTPLAGLGGPRGLFFSPDGQWIGFAVGTTLKKVAINGGPAITLCSINGNPRGATWGADDTIVFATNDASGLWRVPAGGGDPSLLTKPDRERGEGDHLWPEFLPDGQAVLFTITPAVGAADNAQVAVLDLRNGTQKMLQRGGSHAHYLPSGHIVYGIAGTLRAVAFDLERLEALSTPVAVLPQVVTTSFGAANFDVARDGTLVYAPGGLQGAARALVWVDRQGREEPIKAAPPRAYQYPRLSPDGTRLALDIRDQESDIWIWDFARQTLPRLTFDPAPDRFPVWTPDGKRVLFGSDRVGAGAVNLFWQAADGTGAVERLTESPSQQFPGSVSRDGRLVFRENAPTADLMVLRLEKEPPSTPSTRSAGSGSTVNTVDRSTGSGRVELRRAQALLRTPFIEQNGEISPDGRWLAYESNNSGQFETYVRPFPNIDSGQWQVSTGGGTQPLWSRNGRELVLPGAEWCSDERAC